VKNQLQDCGGLGKIQAGGLGDNTNIDRSSLVQIDSQANWVQVFGSGTTGAIKSDGTFWACGNGSTGALGQGADRSSRSSFVQVGSDTNWASFTRVYSGGFIAIKTNGTMWAWGRNYDGCLGLGDKNYRSTPTQVGSLTNWSKVSGYNWISVAIKTNGTLWTWGNGGQGAFGDGTSIGYRSSPAQVGSGTYWTDVAAGHYFCLAIRSNGTLWSWGWNVFGALGLGNTIDRSSPTQVGSNTNWAKIYANEGNIVAIKTDGSMWSWGAASAYLQNDLIARSSPVRVGTGTNWDSCSLQRYGGVALKTDGTVWGFGPNQRGEIAEDRIGRSSPIQIGSSNDWYGVGGDLYGIHLMRN
jgi:alpha-tubulin suppressor-like RCC1 family protein